MLPSSWTLPSIVNNILWHALIKLNVSFDEEHLSPKNTQAFAFIPPLCLHLKIFSWLFLVTPVSVVNFLGLNDRWSDHWMELPLFYFDIDSMIVLLAYVRIKKISSKRRFKTLIAKSHSHLSFSSLNPQRLIAIFKKVYLSIYLLREQCHYDAMS